METRIASLGILISGRGSNMQAIVRACERGELPAEVALVVSNRGDAAGVAWARDRGIPTRVLPHREYPSREAHDRAVVSELRAAGVEWVCLAGYMRLLSPWFVAAYEHHILNIHPSLLPSFPGLHAQEQAWTHGVRWSGCTVHLVDTELDHGPIVEQTAVEVLDGDTVEDLEARILDREHDTYVRALRRLLRDAWTIEGRRVAWQA
jgi:phosphoribosylglycinamide formyltransferase-1